MKLTAVTSLLWGGGAERVLCTLAGGWARQGHEVTILTFQSASPHQYPIDPSVAVRHLDLMADSTNVVQGLLRNTRRVRVLRRAIRESGADIVISFLDHANVATLVATRRLKKPVIISEHIDPSYHDPGLIWRGLRRLMYRSADVLVCPTAGVLAKFQAMTGVRGRVIPNVVSVPSSVPRSVVKQSGNSANRTLIAMGRLVPQKGFDLLLDVFARICNRHPGWSLTIIGTGPLRAQLEEQSKVLNIAELVRFAGEVADPFSLLRAADLFVFPSRFEGFGMALAEAMACGLPVVSFDCPSGPGEIVRDGVDGILVPAADLDALALALNYLMEDADARARLAARAPEVLVRFSREKILQLWQELFEALQPVSAT